MAFILSTYQTWIIHHTRIYHNFIFIFFYNIIIYLNLHTKPLLLFPRQEINQLLLPQKCLKNIFNPLADNTFSLTYNIFYVSIFLEILVAIVCVKFFFTSKITWSTLPLINIPLILYLSSIRRNRKNAHVTCLVVVSHLSPT